MIYCISDIHGEIDRWKAMLKLIQFADSDIIYILGDVIDRNPHGIEILQDIMRRSNVHMLLGNHEQMMLDTFCSGNNYEARRLWSCNGGGNTYRTMVYKLASEERQRILQYVQELPDYREIEVNGQAFYLVHGNVGQTRYARLWGRPEPPPTHPPIPETTVIVGHTCTYFLNTPVGGYDKDSPFRIFHAPGLIDIDCGCGSETDLRRLACLRLDDMAEFYV